MRIFFKLLWRWIKPVLVVILFPISYYAINALLSDAVANGLKKLAEKYKAWEAFSRISETVLAYPLQLMILLILICVLSGTIAAIRQIKKANQPAEPKQTEKLPSVSQAITTPLTTKAEPVPYKSKEQVLAEMYEKNAAKRPHLIVVETLFTYVTETHYDGFSEFPDGSDRSGYPAALVRFENEPIKDKVAEAYRVRAQIEYVGKDGKIIRIHNGLWLDEEESHTSIGIGERAALLLCVGLPLGETPVLVTLEDGRNSTGKLIHKPLTQEVYDVNVRLVYGDDKADFKFWLSIPDLRLDVK